jgi:hypothetical protein
MFQRYGVYWYRDFPSLGSVLSINDPGLERGSTVIRLHDMNRRLADIEMIDGVMRVVSYDGDWVERSLESVRKCYSPRNGPLLTDREFYDILPIRLRGHVRAVRV